MNIIPIPILSDNYVWTLLDTNQPTAVIVDPGEAKPVIHFLKQHELTLCGILITHHHWDHTGGIAELKNQYDIPIYGPANETIDGLSVPLQPDQIIQLKSFPLTLQVIGIPGHTLGHVAYYSPGILFCGDTLFAAGCGRVFEGTAAQMYASLQKIAALPDNTKIYCAHEYTLNNLRFAEQVEPENKKIKERLVRVSDLRKKNLPSLPSLLKEEKETNPFLRCDSPELIANVEKHAGETLSTPVEVFTELRTWKDGFKG